MTSQDFTDQVLQSISNPVRRAVVHSLASQGMPFSDLMRACGLDPNFDTGQFWYHLSELMAKSILRKEEEVYVLTELGVKLSKILDTLHGECAFLLRKKRGENRQMERGKGDFIIRAYKDHDFEGVAILVQQLYRYWWGGMSLEYARKTVTTDLLVPDTRVYVAEHPSGSLIGFISYAIRHGGVFWVEYLWAGEGSQAEEVQEQLLEAVERDVRDAGEDQLHTHFGVDNRRFGEFYLRHGFETLNRLEVTKYLGEAPKRKYTAENAEIFGYKFKRVI